MRVRDIALWVLATMTAWACGGSPEPPAASAADVSPAPVAAATAEPAHVLTPAPAPEDIVAVGRVMSLQGLSDRAVQYSNVPVPLVEELLRYLPGTQAVLHLDGALDFLAILDPESRNSPRILFGVSVGAADFESVLSALRGAEQQLERVSDDVYYFESRRGTYCAIARALGPTPSRFVCGAKRRALDALVPYMTTALPSEQLGDEDVRLVLRAAGLQRRYGKQANMIKMGVPILLRELSQGNARFDGALADAAHGVAAELVTLADELETLTLTLRFTEAPDNAELSLGLALHGQRSWLSRMLTRRAAEMEVPSEHFWRLPGDATAAWYMGAVDGQVSAPLVQGMKELVAGALDIGNVKVTTRDQWTESFEAAGLWGTEVVGCSLPAPGGSAESIVQAMGAVGDGGALDRFVKSSLALADDKGLRAAVSEKLGLPATSLPNAKKARTPRGLAKGSTAWTVEVDASLADALTKKGDAAPPSKKTFLVISMPTADVTWLVYGDSPKDVEARALALSAQGPEQPTLAGVPAVQVLRQQRALTGGFLTLKGLAVGADELPWPAIRRAMPHRGEVPMFYASRATAEGPSLGYQIQLPRAVAEDLVAGIVAAAAEKGEL